MKREVSSLFFHPYASHTPAHDAQPCPKDLGVPERERKKKERKRKTTTMPRMPRMPRDVVRSAILPKEKKKELSCLGLIKFPECDRCGQITAATESRTRDPKICNLMLYQLSYHRVQNALYIPRIMLYILLPTILARNFETSGLARKFPKKSHHLRQIVFGCIPPQHVFESSKLVLSSTAELRMTHPGHICVTGQDPALAAHPAAA